ncbi:MAG: hypothetical protein QGH94_11645 [Phycisphaerae bacterium]|jgi:hypothetical protein|nr:hypothetical protein [Phycisphaerae bacterium]MDP7288634.1 hypothetical protein [Phycisphaerae bacterium]
MPNKTKLLICAAAVFFAVTGVSAETYFNMKEIRDPGTLKVSVIKDWHAVGGRTPTRQKVIEITVGQAHPGKDYRIKVQFAVPADKKAKGFHLTSGVSDRDMTPRGFDSELIQAGVGLVKTHIGNISGDLKKPRDDLFYKTLDPRYRNFWIWPATFMRAITAAYAEKDHFEKGKILVSGFSKVGETSAITLINDERVTAAFGVVCPIYASDVRLSNPKALARLEAYNQAQSGKKPSGGRRGRRPRGGGWLGGLAGPSMKRGALAAGKTPKQLQDFAEKLADYLFISRNVKKLKARGAEFLFHPGTHDMVSYDGIWGGMNASEVPVYNGANSGHGKKGLQANLKESNRAAFILNHFIGGKKPMLTPPAVTTKVRAGKLEVTVTFKPGSEEESGRVFWIFDRGPDATSAYLENMIPEKNWKDMTRNKSAKAWTVEIDLDKNASCIDVFSNHQKTLPINGKKYTTAISSPYTRVKLSGSEVNP